MKNNLLHKGRKRGGALTQ